MTRWQIQVVTTAAALFVTACGGCGDAGTPSDGIPRIDLGADAGIEGDGGEHPDADAPPDGGDPGDDVGGDDDGGADDGGDDECTETCSTAGATRCEGGALQECVERDGCLQWGDGAPCTDGLLCSGGQCVEQCQDSCTTVGARRCEGGGSGTVAECQLADDGCLAWQQVQACGGDETCSNGSCATQCADECGAVNDRACEADGYRVCGNFDDDPCLDWGDVVPCNGDATCSGGYCAVQCTDECTTAGSRMCVAGGNGFAECGNFDGDPCLEWGTTTNCSSGEVCESGACAIDDPCQGVVCQSPPADSCVDANTARRYEATGACNGSGGCDYGYVDTHCPDGCQNAACVAPTCGGTTCDAPPADVCASSSELTRYFPLGVCDADVCEYQSTTIVCSEGCFQGACISGSWETEHPPLDYPDHDAMDIEFDAAGDPHIAYCQGYPYDLIYRWRDASGWHEETIDPGLTPTQSSRCEVAVSLDAQGRPIVAYHDPANEDLRVARRIGGAWSLELVATSGSVGRAPSVSVTPGGDPIVAYRDATSDELVAATWDGTTWQHETVGAWDLGGTASPITEMRWSRSGDLHILAGSTRSIANPQGNYNQPPVYLHTKSGGAWSRLTVHEDGFVGRDHIAVTPTGDLLILVGVVLQVGANDQLRLVRTDGASVLDDQMVRSVSNLLYAKPVGVFNTDTMTQVAFDEFHFRLDDHGYWVTRPTPADSQGVMLRLLWSLGDDRFRILHGGWRITVPAACTPECSGRTCGSDGCGGTCGTCSGGDSCSPLGQCTAWQYESPGVLTDRGTVATGMHEVHAFGYDAELIHSSNVGGAWSSAATGLASMTQHTVARDDITVDGHGAILIPTTQHRPTHYNAWDKIEVFVWDGTSWTSTIVDEYFYSNASAMQFEVDPNDVWHFAIAERKYPDYAGSQLTYVKYENGAATREVIATPEDQWNRGYGEAQRIRLEIDSQGHAHIMWVQSLTYTNQTSLHYATNGTGSWVDVTLEDPYESSEFSMAIDANDTLHAMRHRQSYYDPDQYGTFDATAGAWVWEDLPMGSPTPVQFGLDPSDVPFVVQRGTSSLDIYRRQSAGSWALESIPTFSGPASMKLMFDDGGNPHVFYSAGSGQSQSQTRHAWK